MAPGPTVAICANLVQVAPWHCSILNPSSLIELSVQVRLIWLLDTAVAFRLLGVAGSAGGAKVVAKAVFE
jgi:hypothetical protein